MMEWAVILALRSLIVVVYFNSLHLNDVYPWVFWVCSASTICCCVRLVIWCVRLRL